MCFSSIFTFLYSLDHLNRMFPLIIGASKSILDTNNLKPLPDITTQNVAEMPLQTFVQRCNVPHFLPTSGGVIDLKFLETGYQWLWINLEQKYFLKILHM